jgi:hypothetical protein
MGFHSAAWLDVASGRHVEPVIQAGRSQRAQRIHGASRAHNRQGTRIRESWNSFDVQWKQIGNPQQLGGTWSSTRW